MDYIKNLQLIDDKIAAAALRSGRNPEDITLLAVSKVFPVEVLKKVYDTGVRLFGESRPQELRDKMPLLPADIKWHFIGPLQTNKLKYVVPHAELIHAVDSEKLATAIADFAGKKSISASVLIEINTSGEALKRGFPADIAVEQILKISELNHLQIKGLMTMAPYTEDISLIRNSFSLLKKKFDEIKKYLNKPDFNTLSMGMSGDFEIAIEEGSTLVRVGSGIFGPRRR